ncbi:MAG: hypothetical protein P9X22_04290 [Candidatus Zapsychrus exili]|nr:hypothetical protein [Candidatus Zapsychrus exili]
MILKAKKNKINLDIILEEELLDLRICDLPIRIEGTWLEECIDELYKELENKGISFRPKCYLADEWLTPEGETCIGIPFYLAHPSLMKLEKKFMLEVEGGIKQWCMKLLRHEAGHAISHAYKLHKRKIWQRLFGPSDKEYKDTYKYRPYSKNYVQHLDGYYAQYHPDEDFVETFAVWLTPHLDWRMHYKGWGALKKIKYVDSLMDELSEKETMVKSSNKYWSLSTLRSTLKNHYKRKRHSWEEEFPDFHDDFLRKNFADQTKENKKSIKARDVIRKYRTSVLNSVSKYSGEKKYVINDFLKDIQKRSKELNLVSVQDDFVIAMNLSVYTSALIMNYLYTGSFRGDKKKKKGKIDA